MPRLALTGGAYQARSVIASAQRSLNLYPEPMAQNAGEPAQFAHYPTPGLTLLNTLPADASGNQWVRGIYQVTTGQIYAVCGSSVYSIDPATYAGTHLGDITTLRQTPVGMKDNGTTLFIVDGTANGWTVDIPSNKLTQIPSIPSDTQASLTGGTLSPSDQTTLLSTLQGIGNGAFQITLNGNDTTIGPHDFTHITSLQDAASLIGDNVIITCNWTGSQFVIVSTLAGSASSLTYASTPSTGTDISTDLKLTQATGASAPVSGVDSLAFYGSPCVDYLDGYMLFAKPNTPQFYISNNMAATFDPNYWANKQSAADLLVTLKVAKREIWLFGTKATEIWFNAGAADFPFQEVPSVFVAHGCAAVYSPIEFDGRVFWLSTNEAGQGIVMEGGGYQTQRISTYAIEEALKKYTVISDAIGMKYSLGGHTFYVLSFPTQDTTWVYDIFTSMWHEWLWLDSNGREHRNRVNCMYNCNGVIVAGDWQNGNLYKVDASALTDNGAPIKRQRSFPHVLNEGKRVFYREFIADLESGNPIAAPGVVTLASCMFTAPDNTLLEAYNVAGETRWTLASGVSAPILQHRLMGPAAGGTSVYQSPNLAIVLGDYTVQFKAIPAVYNAVSSDAVYAFGRSTGPGTGYYAQVSGDGWQYWLTAGVAGGTPPASADGPLSLPMGTLPSGWYQVMLYMQGNAIDVSVQRSCDEMWLNMQGLWQADFSYAVSFEDSTYAERIPGAALIGGQWAVRSGGLVWPPFIAQLSGLPSNTLHLVALPDWQRGVVYFIDDTSNSKYSLQLTTQPAPVASVTFPSSIVETAGLDPLSGAILVQRLGAGSNGAPVVKLDPGSFAQTGSFGAVTASPSYPVSVWIGQALVCIICNGFSYALLKESAFSGHVAAIRVDTMQQAGFYAPVVSGSTDNRGIMCAGASGGATATAFLTWQDLQVTTTIPLYVITITAGAENYNPASWPTTNPNITWATAGTIAASAIDPTWSHLMAHSIGYDQADGNVIMHVATTDAVAQQYYVAKIRATNATVMWVVPVSSQTHMMLQTSRINGMLWAFDGTTSLRIDTLAGTMISQPLTGTFDNLPGYPITDSTNRVALYYGNFSTGPTNPVPVSGTGNFTNSWGFMGGVAATPPTLAMDDLLVVATPPSENRIWLDWSDDRGHSYGNPVGQSIGEPGAYLTSLQWQRCGYARDRIWRLTWTAPVQTALQGAWIEAQPGLT